jgi:HSP20 family molecular chaperone IbpA
MYPIHSTTASNPNSPSALKFFQDLDKYSHYFTRLRHPLQGTTEQHLRQTFFPNFDVRELDNDFELHGELPGVKKEDIKIEFSGPKTLEISGFVESSYTYPPRASDQSDIPVAQNKEGPREPAQAESKPQEEDKADGPGEVTKAASGEVGQPGNVKYWASERSLGEFQRLFTFPCHVQQENTTATLDSGVLTVHIPKLPSSKSAKRVIQIS